MQQNQNNNNLAVRQSLRNKNEMISFADPKSESQKDGEASSGLHADIPHERTSEQFNAANAADADEQDNRDNA